MYRDGDFDTLDLFNYGVNKDGFINNAAPGVFFYYAGPIILDGDPWVVTQTNSELWDDLAVQQVQAYLYDENCNRVGSGIEDPTTGTVTFDTSTLPSGDHFIGIKYNTGPIVGTPVVTPYPTSKYVFEVTNDPVVTQATIFATPKP